MLININTTFENKQKKAKQIKIIVILLCQTAVHILVLLSDSNVGIKLFSEKKGKITTMRNIFFDLRSCDSIQAN